MKKRLIRRSSQLVAGSSGSFASGSKEKAIAANLKAAASRLQESEEHFRSMFDSVDEGFCVVEVSFDSDKTPNDYTFLQVNTAFERLTGLIAPIGKSVRTLLPGVEIEWIQKIGTAVKSGQSVRFTNPVEELERTFSVYACRIGGAGSQRAAVVFTDITAATAADNDLRRTAAELSESDRKKNEFLATLAHELRNPLAPLMNGLHLLRHRPHDAASTTRMVDLMERQVKQMVHLVNDLLDISRISTGKIELKCATVDLSTILAAVVEASEHLFVKRGQTFTKILQDRPVLLFCDATRISQILGNLLNNASKYTQQGGAVELTVILVSGHVLIAISDNGAGLDPQVRSSIFDMFNQIDATSHMGQGGLGIGLSLVRTLVELHNGKVTAESAGLGKGSTFSVSLPVIGINALASEITASINLANAVQSSAMRILVVDDNEDAASSMALILEQVGHEVCIANDGLLAVREAARFSPEFVFLDIGLPGLNGYEVVRAIRAIDGLEKVPVVALTGWGTTNDVTHALEAGFDSHLTKPAGMAQILTLIDQLRL